MTLHEAKLIVEARVQQIRFPVGAVIYIPRNRHPNAKKSLWMIMSQFFPEQQAYLALNINTLEYKHLYTFDLGRGQRIA